jgi:hypothetical protein
MVEIHLAGPVVAGGFFGTSAREKGRWSKAICIFPA